MGAATSCADLRAVSGLVLRGAVEVEVVVFDWCALVEDHVGLVRVLENSFEVHCTVDGVLHVDCLFEGEVVVPFFLDLNSVFSVEES